MNNEIPHGSKEKSYLASKAVQYQQEGGVGMTHKAINTDQEKRDARL